jgi:hypothetical protein
MIRRIVDRVSGFPVCSLPSAARSASSNFGTRADAARWSRRWWCNSDGSFGLGLRVEQSSRSLEQDYFDVPWVAPSTPLRRRDSLIDRWCSSWHRLHARQSARSDFPGPVVPSRGVSHRLRCFYQSPRRAVIS